MIPKNDKRTLEDEIIEQAKFYNDKGTGDVHVAFQRAAEWAASLVLSRTCEWLKNHIDYFIDDDTNELYLNKLLESLCKSIKG